MYKDAWSLLSENESNLKSQHAYPSGTDGSCDQNMNSYFMTTSFSFDSRRWENRNAISQSRSSILNSTPGGLVPERSTISVQEEGRERGKCGSEFS